VHITTEEVVVEDDVDHYRDSAGMYIREPVSLPRVRYVDCGAFPTFYITLYDFIFRYIEKVFYISSYIGIYNQICGSPVL